VSHENYVTVERQLELILLAGHGCPVSAVREAILDGARGAAEGKAVGPMDGGVALPPAKKNVREMLRGLAELVEAVERGLIDPAELGMLPARLVAYTTAQKTAATLRNRVESREPVEAK
jgi:hypothetical protein